MTEDVKTVLHLTEKPDSITVKETAKGDLYFDCKVYGNTESDMDELLERVSKMYEGIVKRMRPTNK